MSVLSPRPVFLIWSLEAAYARSIQHPQSARIAVILLWGRRRIERLRSEPSEGGGRSMK